jgi:HlyD family secretion protein
MGKLKFFLAAILVALIGSYFLYQSVQRHGRLPENLVTVDGRIEGRHVLVASRIAGRVKRLAVAPGDVLVKGQVVAELEDDALLDKVVQVRRDLGETLARMHAITRELAASRLDVPPVGQAGGIGGARQGIQARERELDGLAAQESRLRSTLEETQVVLADMLLTSPVDGVVAGALAAVGDLLAAGAPVAAIVDAGSLYFQAAVPEALASRLRLGLPGRVSVEGCPGRTFPATLGFMAAKASPAVAPAGEAGCAIRLFFRDTPVACLPSGQPARAEIRGEERTGGNTPGL